MDTSGLFRVDGLVTVITGGGTGIGRTMALALASAGARTVFILDRRVEPLNETASLYPEVIVPISCDVSDKSSIQAAVDKVTRQTTDDKSPSGYINLLINSAGVFGSGASLLNDEGTGRASIAQVRQRFFADADMKAFTDALHINVTGVLFSAWAFLELLDAGNRRSSTNGGPTVQSQIVNVASVGAYLRGGPKHEGENSVYGASKAAVVQTTKQMSTMLAPFGIRANVLAPGLFPTDMSAGAGLIGDRKPEEESPEYQHYIPAKRFGTDEDMAGTILYLASRAGAYCNGMVLVADGGKLSVALSTY